jgi:hypothetical protein
MRETCTGPDVKKRKEKLQTKQTGARKRGMKIKHKLFLLLYLFKKAVGHFVVVFFEKMYSAPLFERGYKCVSFQA